jgi:hypothetical protein
MSITFKSTANMSTKERERSNKGNEPTEDVFTNI